MNKGLFNILLRNTVCLYNMKTPLLFLDEHSSNYYIGQSSLSWKANGGITSESSIYRSRLHVAQNSYIPSLHTHTGRQSYPHAHKCWRLWLWLKWWGIPWRRVHLLRKSRYILFTWLTIFSFVNASVQNALLKTSATICPEIIQIWLQTR
jgi:hypothetical protein